MKAVHHPEVGEGTASLRVPVLPSVVEDLYDEPDGVNDFMSPIKLLQTQAVTDDDQCKRNSIYTSYCNIRKGSLIGKIVSGRNYN